MKKVFAFVCMGIILATACKKDNQKNVPAGSVVKGALAMQHDVTFNKYTDTTEVKIKLTGAKGEKLTNLAGYADKITVWGQQPAWSEALEAFVIKRKGLDSVKIEFKGDKGKVLSRSYYAADDQYLNVSLHNALSVNKDYDFSWTGRQLENNESVRVDIKQENRKLNHFSLFTTVGRPSAATGLPVSLATYNKRLDQISRLRVNSESQTPTDAEKAMLAVLKSAQDVSGDSIVPGPAAVFFNRKSSNSSLQQKKDGITYYLTTVTGHDIKINGNGPAVDEENRQ